jgi:hypothetical protein
MPALASLAAFTQAVAEFPVSDPGLVLEPAARGAAERSAAESGLVLLGEVHGVRENPLLISALLQALGLTGLTPVRAAHRPGPAVAEAGSPQRKPHPRTPLRHRSGRAATALTAGWLLTAAGIWRSLRLMV